MRSKASTLSVVNHRLGLDVGRHTVFLKLLDDNLLDTRQVGLLVEEDVADAKLLSNSLREEAQGDFMEQGFTSYERLLLRHANGVRWCCEQFLQL